jgi:hypothetical protein
VRCDGGACPFCDAPLPRAEAPRPDLITRGTRLSRAAVLAGATALGGLGCGASNAEEERIEREPPDWTTGHERTVTTIDVSHGRGGTGQGGGGDSDQVIVVTDDDDTRLEEEERERREQELREQELLEEQNFRHRNCDQCPYGAPPPPRRTVV